MAAEEEKQESSGGKRQDLYQQTGSVQTASVSKTTYFYQVGRKQWLCGPSVFIDAVLCAGPGYLTTAVHVRLSGRSVWAWAQSGLALGAPTGLKWPIKLVPCFYWEHCAFAFLDRYGFYKQTKHTFTHRHRCTLTRRSWDWTVCLAYNVLKQSPAATRGVTSEWSRCCFSASLRISRLAKRHDLACFPLKCFKGGLIIFIGEEARQPAVRPSRLSGTLVNQSPSTRRNSRGQMRTHR